jgi:alanyl-tRNA synthetase
VTTETSSAANVRRVEAITGPVAIGELRHNDRHLSEAAALLRTQPHQVPAVVAEREARRRELEKQGPAQAAPVDTSFDAVDIDGVKAVFETKDVPNPKALPEIADTIRGRLGDPAVIVLGARGEGRVNLLVAATPGAVARGVKAGDIVKAAARVVGGGGGGRDTMAQAGGRDPEKLPDALRTAEEAVRQALA